MADENRQFQPCPFCDNEPGGCCACDHFGTIPRGHYLWDAVQTEQVENDG